MSQRILPSNGQLRRSVCLVCPMSLTPTRIRSIETAKIHQKPGHIHHAKALKTSTQAILVRTNFFLMNDLLKNCCEGRKNKSAIQNENENLVQ